MSAAVVTAATLHRGQFRRTPAGQLKVPYVVHLLRTASILRFEWGLTDRNILAASLLHDILEDCRPSYAGTVRLAFGRQVFRAVKRLTRPQPINGNAESKKKTYSDYVNALKLSPRWIRTIKCADRLDNLRDAVALGDPIFWDRYRRETQQVLMLAPFGTKIRADLEGILKIGQKRYTTESGESIVSTLLEG